MAERVRVQWVEVDESKVGEELAFFRGGPYLPEPGEEIVSAAAYDLLRIAIEQEVERLEKEAASLPSGRVVQAKSLWRAAKRLRTLLQDTGEQSQPQSKGEK